MKQRESSQPVPIFVLLDEAGCPFASSLQAIFRPLQARFRSQFRSIRDEAIIHNLLDQAAQHYAREVEAGKRILQPEAYAWTILCNLGVSELRRSEVIVSNGSLGGAVGERVLLAQTASVESPEAIHARIHAKEIYAQLSERERPCTTLKVAGYTSVVIARVLEMTPGGVDKLMQRLRDRIRSAAVESKKVRGGLGLWRVTDPKSPGGS